MPPTYCDASGRPDPNGEFEIAPRRKTMRDGEYVGFESFLIDGKQVSFSDAAAKAPASIDEALRQRFAEMAKNQGTSVEDLLAGMEHRKLEETAADVAKVFVASLAAAGVASRFKDTSGLLSPEAAASATARGIASVMKVDASAAVRLRALNLPTAPIRDTAAANKTSAEAVRDAVRDSRYSPQPASGCTASPAPVSVSAETMRNLARSARYGG